MSALSKITKGSDGERDEKMERLVKLRNRPRSRQTKLIKASSGRAAAIAVTPNLIDISAPDTDEGQPIGISVVGGSGLVFRGPVGFTEAPGEIRINGMWKFNNLLLSAAPSTIMTPIPTLLFSPPMESIAKHMASAAVIAAMVGVL